jgi:hypothetical protein
VDSKTEFNGVGGLRNPHQNCADMRHFQFVVVTYCAGCCAAEASRGAGFLTMRDSNVGYSVLGKVSSTTVSAERRLLGWTVTLVGAALMAGGGLIVFLSAF